jgi:hypothetical protein
VGLLNTPPHAQHYWAWCVDINGGWPDSGNLITGSPMDRGEALISLCIQFLEKFKNCFFQDKISTFYSLINGNVNKTLNLLNNFKFI